MPANGFKFALKVANWPFQSVVNRLQVLMHTDAEDSASGCASTANVNNDESANLRSITIQLNGVNLYPTLASCLMFFEDKRYGRFLEIALLDSAIKSVSYSYDSANSNVVIESPHFWNTLGRFRTN